MTAPKDKFIGSICKCAKGRIGLVLYKSKKTYHGVRLGQATGSPWESVKPKIIIPRRVLEAWIIHWSDNKE